MIFVQGNKWHWFKINYFYDTATYAYKNYERMKVLDRFLQIQFCSFGYLKVKNGTNYFLYAKFLELLDLDKSLKCPPAGGWLLVTGAGVCLV